ECRQLWFCWPALTAHGASIDPHVAYDSVSAEDDVLLVDLRHSLKRGYEAIALAALAVDVHVSRLRCSSEATLSASSASCSDICQLTLGSWAVGLRKAPKTPRSMLANPRCSDHCVGLCRALHARSG